MKNLRLNLKVGKLLNRSELSKIQGGHFERICTTVAGHTECRCYLAEDVEDDPNIEYGFIC